MHLSPPSLTHNLMKHWPARLAAIIAVGVVLSLWVASTRATTTSPQRASNVASYQDAPAGTRGPIRLSCTRDGVATIGADGPAGPQGPVGVSCAPSPAG